MRFEKPILFFGQNVVLSCDGKCSKAWGMQCRPRVQVDPSNDDSFFWPSDNELGEAPGDPGTYEGECAKPENPDGMNKWCARQCERSRISDPGRPKPLPDFSRRLYNRDEDEPT